MKTELANTTIHNSPHAFTNNKGDPILITTLDESRHQQLIDMYLAYESRNSFGGLPPIRDEVCVQWVEKMVATGINLVALSFDEDVVGHAALFPIDERMCEILVVVSPPNQKMGIGTELIRCSIQIAHELGVKTIRLVVDVGNHVARHVYEKCGFEYLTHDLSCELDMALDVHRHAGDAIPG